MTVRANNFQFLLTNNFFVIKWAIVELDPDEPMEEKMKYPEFLEKNGTIGFVAPSFGCSIEPYRTEWFCTWA